MSDQATEGAPETTGDETTAPEPAEEQEVQKEPAAHTGEDALEPGEPDGTTLGEPSTVTAEDLTSEASTDQTDSDTTLDLSEVKFGGSHALRIPHPGGGWLAVQWNGLTKRLHS